MKNSLYHVISGVVDLILICGTTAGIIILLSPGELFSRLPRPCGFLCNVIVFGGMLCLPVFLGTIFDNWLEALKNKTKAHQPQEGSQPEDSYQLNALLYNVLVLAAYIIRIDGKVMHSEMQIVRVWLNDNYGAENKEKGENILVFDIFNKQKEMGMEQFRNNKVIRSCKEISNSVSYEERLKLLKFLFKIAKADGMLITEKMKALCDCGCAMLIKNEDLTFILSINKSGNNLENAYKILGVSPSASYEELVAAYRSLIRQYHPDRVATMGEEIRKVAEKKTQEFNAAKDIIWKARGLR